MLLTTALRSLLTSSSRLLRDRSAPSLSARCPELMLAAEGSVRHKGRCLAEPHSRGNAGPTAHHSTCPAPLRQSKEQNLTVPKNKTSSHSVSVARRTRKHSGIQENYLWCMTDHDFHENSGIKTCCTFILVIQSMLRARPPSLRHAHLITPCWNMKTRLGCKARERRILISRLRMDKMKLFTKFVELLKAVMGSLAPVL